MSTSFTCSNGHHHPLQFTGDDVSKPCPSCGEKIYRYRDAAGNEIEASSAQSDISKTGKERFSLKRKTIAITLAGVVVLFAARLYLEHRNVESQPVAPVETAALAEPQALPLNVSQPVSAPPASPAQAPAATISGLQTQELQPGIVNVKFRLTNTGALNRYPDLIVTWQGVSDPQQTISSDAYGHPPLPFSSADVALELAKPPGATGIDVHLKY